MYLIILQLSFNNPYSGLKYSLEFSFRVLLTIQRKMLCWGDKQNMAEIYREKSLRWIAFWGRTAIK